MTVVFDIETNGLYHKATELHCISIKVDDNQTKVYTSKHLKGSDGTIEEGLDILANADLLIGHNIINFDLPTIKKLYWWWGYKGKLIDTLICTKLRYPYVVQ